MPWFHSDNIGSRKLLQTVEEPFSKRAWVYFRVLELITRVPVKLRRDGNDIISGRRERGQSVAER